MTVCICPAHAHPEFVQRATDCFNSQRYPLKRFELLDTSGLSGWSVGAIRNTLISHSSHPGEIIAHFDYDDWSAPERLSQQVALMELTGRPIVGYYDMAFYDQTRDRVLFYDSNMRNYALGTSLMYHREIWEKNPFPDQTPEDTTWQFKIGPQNIASISSIRKGKPMMIQVYHGANAAASVHGAMFEPASPELDREVRRILGK